METKEEKVREEVQEEVKNEVCAGCVIKYLKAQKTKETKWWTRRVSASRRNHSCKECNQDYINDAAKAVQKPDSGGRQISRNGYWHLRASTAILLVQERIERNRERRRAMKQEAIDDLCLQERLERDVFEEAVRLRVKTLFHEEGAAFYDNFDQIDRMMTATLYHLRQYEQELKEAFAEETVSEEVVAA